jgi:hypothetical protein
MLKNKISFKYNLLYLLCKISLLLLASVLLFSLLQGYFGGVLLCDSISNNVVEDTTIISVTETNPTDSYSDTFKGSPGVLLKSKNTVRRKLY